MVPESGGNQHGLAAHLPGDPQRLFQHSDGASADWLLIDRNIHRVGALCRTETGQLQAAFLAFADHLLNQQAVHIVQKEMGHRTKQLNFPESKPLCRIQKTGQREFDVVAVHHRQTERGFQRDIPRLSVHV